MHTSIVFAVMALFVAGLAQSEVLVNVTIAEDSNNDTTTVTQIETSPTLASTTMASASTTVPSTTVPSTVNTTSLPSTVVVNTQPPPTTTVSSATTAMTQATNPAATNAPTTPGPDDGSVKLSYKDNSTTCILLQGNISLIFRYIDDGNKNQDWTIALPSDAKVTAGSCGAKEQTMTVTFGSNLDVLDFKFAKDGGNTYISKIVLDYTMDNVSYPGINTTRKALTATSKDGKMFEGSTGMPYKCKSNLNNTLAGQNETVIFSTIDFEFAAFRTVNNTDFNSKYVNCPEDSVTSNIVPIAVGAALAALVVIVLIAYLISRNRNKRGYESV